METPHTFSRHDLEQVVEYDAPEASRAMFRVGMSPMLMLLFMDWMSERGPERVELVKVTTAGPISQDLLLFDAEVRFYKRDAVEADLDPTWKVPEEKETA